METNKIIKYSVIGLVALIVIFTIGWFVSTDIETDNREVDLRNAVTAKVSDEEATFDKMWKILAQKAQVADQYKGAFKEIFPALIEGRYSKGDGSLMKWIQESNPSFDASLYKDLMASIDVERNAFLTTQRQLIDLKREHDNLRMKWPSKWFINADVQEIQIKIISSETSKETMRTGMENDINLFKK